MAARKPNNLPWVIFGVIGGLVVLGLFGFGVYFGAKSVSDEMRVNLPVAPDASEQSVIKNQLMIRVTAENEIFLEDTPIKDVADLEAQILALTKKNSKETFLTVRVSEDASHKILISTKGMLDDLGMKNIILIDQSRAE